MAYVQCMHCGRGAVTGAYVARYRVLRTLRREAAKPGRVCDVRRTSPPHSCPGRSRARAPWARETDWDRVAA